MTERDGLSHPLPEDVFNDALELPAEQRAAFLDANCPAGEVRRLVADMLRLADSDPSLRHPPEPEAIPRQLGKYELLQESGRGGMGIVYTARDTQLGRVVALKVLPAPLAADPRGRERFLREARLLAALSDARIATIHTIEEAEGIHFLTMENIEGRTLAQRIAEGPLPVGEALAIGRQIAEALAGAHAKQIVHRDLKPSNIMVTPGGGVKILDFGIAKMLGAGVATPVEMEATAAGWAPGAGAAAGASASATGAAIAAADPALSQARGTPGYMAPEQLRGEPVDLRCDIWAFGCVLYESLSGRYVSELADREGRFPLLGLPASLPREARALLEACLEREPGRRTITAARAAEILATAARRFWARRRRRRAAVAAGIAAPLFLLAVLGLRIFLAPGTLAAVEPSGPQTLRAVDATGRTVWSRALPAPLAAVGGLQPLIVKRADGEACGILAVLLAEGLPSSVCCLDPEDGSPRWTWEAAWQSPVNALGHLTISALTVLPWPGREAPAIAVTVHDTPWYGAAIQFLDEGGESLGTYYHPGPAGYLQAMPRGPGGEIRYLLAGVNSSARFVRALVPFETRFHCGFVALLAPPDLGGQAFPWSEGLPEPRDWPGLPRAREAAYLAIPPLLPGVESTVVSIHVRTESGEPQIVVQIRDGRVLFLDSALQPLSCYVGIRSAADSLSAAGERLPPLMLIREGAATWHDVPLRF